MPKARRAVKIALDVLMALDLVAVMAAALVEEAFHEFSGVALVVLMAAHAVMNRRYFIHLAKGRYTFLRAFRLVVLVGLVACVIGQAASAVVLSRHAFAFLPALPGASLARRAHMLCSYWCFVLAFVHAGLQAKMGVPAPLQALLVGAACFGVVSFLQLGFPGYLFGQVPFAAADYTAGLPVSVARYASVAALAFAAAYCPRSIARALRRGGLAAK